MKGQVTKGLDNEKPERVPQNNRSARMQVGNYEDHRNVR